MHLRGIIPAEARAVGLGDGGAALAGRVNHRAAGVGVLLHDEVGLGAPFKVAAQMASALFCARVEVEGGDYRAVVSDREGLEGIYERKTLRPVVGVLDEIGNAVENLVA